MKIHEIKLKSFLNVIKNEKNNLLLHITYQDLLNPLIIGKTIKNKIIFYRAPN